MAAHSAVFLVILGICLLAVSTVQGQYLSFGSPGGFGFTIGDSGYGNPYGGNGYYDRQGQGGYYDNGYYGSRPGYGGPGGYYGNQGGYY